jgi:hypothetical protein
MELISSFGAEGDEGEIKGLKEEDGEEYAKKKML